MKLNGYEAQLKPILDELRLYLMRQGGKKDVAEDIVQDVFVKVLEMDLFLPPNKVKPYMYRMAKNRYIDYYRRRQKLQSILTTYLIPQSPTAHPGIINRLDPDISRAMARLSSKERELLKLKYLDEWSINEIAVRQHKRPSSIKMQLYRARKKLRKVMAENDE